MKSAAVHSQIVYSNEGITFPVAVGEALLAFAGKNIARPHVAVGTCDEAHLSATDGHTALRFLGCTPGGTQPMTYARSVWTRETVDRAVKVAKATKGQVSLLWTERAKDLNFPPMSTVVPSAKMSAKEPVGLNPDYLARLSKVAKACGQAFVALAGLGDPLDPVLFHVTGISLRAEVVIMPGRL